MSHEAYAEAHKSGAAPRDIEYQAFANATRGLLKAMEVGREDLRGMVEALHANRALWTALANDCASDANALPQETRARIIGLSRWVYSYSSDVMRKREPIDPLVDINRIMMDGLAGREAG